jgi:mono/diheme cytochrome c family protein
MYLHCSVCHGARRQEGGLDLRTRASMLKGGIGI